VNLFQTSFTEEELRPVVDVLVSGNIGFGSNVEKFECEISSYSKKEFNIATNSASAAAFMIFHFLRESHGICDIYTPSLAFASPAWAAKHFGHNLNFVDVDKNLLFDCRDYKQKRSKLQSNNKIVLMPILYGGVSSVPNWDVFGDEIVVVDSAHSITPTIESDFTFFSFHPYKPVCTSDGGVISTSNKEAAEYFYSYRNFGRTPLSGTYDIEQEGFKFYMNNLNATIGLVSLEKYHENLNIRKENYTFLKDNINLKNEVLLHDNSSSFYFATVFTENSNTKMNKLKMVKLYPLLHKTKYFSQNIPLKNTEKLYNCYCNLPLHGGLSDGDLDLILQVINE
jgi:dTDP-4-amino-4,6-dideoxygalactose transaminase